MNKQEIEKAIKLLKHHVATWKGKFPSPHFEACKVAVECMEKQLTNGWIPVSERLPQLPDGKSFMPLNATILAPSGLRNTVQMTWELKRGKPTWCYLGQTSDWNVIAWQPLPEPWKGEEE